MGDLEAMLATTHFDDQFRSAEAKKAEKVFPGLMSSTLTVHVRKPAMQNLDESSISRLSDLSHANDSVL